MKKTSESCFKSSAGLALVLLVAFFEFSASGQSNCVQSPPNLVSWWRAEANAADHAGANNGALLNGATYGAGRVGQSFVFDGNADAVQLGNPASLQLQDLTIEAWVKRASASVVSLTANEAALMGYGPGGYALTLFNDGSLMLTRVEVDAVSVSAGVTDTNWHHLAMTKSGSAVVFYVDGVAYPAPAYNPTFAFTTSVAIGARGDNLSYGFYGSIDETAVYSRALTATEIQNIFSAGGAGKCTAPVAPSISTQPDDQTAFVGGAASFSVAAAGDTLIYQWLFNDTNIISGATNSLLSLTNLQLTNAGNYSVIVSNEVSAVTSSNAVLTVNVQPSCINAPTGLVSWWRAEANATDQAGANNGALLNGATYGTGRVGQSFVFDGNTDAVQLGNPANLRLQDLTIETWVKRASASVVSLTANEAALAVYGPGGYGFVLINDGSLMLTRVEVDAVSVSAGVTDTNWHHLAMTKSGSAVVFYVDGVAYPAPAYNPTFAFSTSVAIGARGDNLSYGFYGSIDEMAVYNRALTATEIQNIYLVSGKCSPPVAPTITSQPVDQTAFVGGAASFSVAAAGDNLSYQWLFNDTNVVNGAASFSLSLSNLQLTNAGNYSVIVSNEVSAVTSSNAVLTVNVQPSCINAPTGLVSWWRAEANATDQAGANNGALLNGATYGTGRVGQSFVFDGNADAVQLGNPASLQLQNLTIEAWVKRASASVVSLTANEAALMGYGLGGYALTLFNNGNLMLTKVGVDAVSVSAGVTDTNWHHLAMTKSGSAVVFYVDGVAYPAPAYNPTFAFTTSVAIGARGDNLSYGFYGSIDETAVYSRALTATEIQNIYSTSVTGKCPTTFPPSITSNPTNRTVVTGAFTTFTITATGTQPLSYQWLFNETNIIAGATNSQLVLSNIQFSDTGNYAVTVTNAGGSLTSSTASLTVVYPPALVRLVGNQNAVAGSTTDLPVHLVANGNENALGFSISYNTNLLAFHGVTQGSGATNASLFYNTTQTNLGRIGLLLGLGSGQTFSGGTQEIALVSFDVVAIPASSNRTTGITLGDTPTPRQLSDVAAVSLSAFYSNTSLTIPAAEWEADTAPRTNGDTVVSVTDWVQVGRFVAHLDTPNNGGEYQRADCAPRSTLGNGVLSVTDWVQAGRYAAGLDSLTAVGGPTSEGIGLLTSLKVGKSGPMNLTGRTLRVANKTVQAAVTNTISVQLDAQGDENALAFSLSFDPVALQFVSVSAGSGVTAPGTLFNMNTDQIPTGKLGIALALPQGLAFTLGTIEIAKVSFAVSPTAQGTSNVVFVNSPILREVSDSAANALATTYTPGTVTISPFPPVLRINADGTNVSLAWPVVSSNYVLQVSDSVSANWTNAVEPVVVVGQDNVVTAPNIGTKFYRLFKP